MSLYNALFGFNPACILILPMIGRGGQEGYPRFRDCFVTDEGNIAVYTRVGGNNRNCGYGEEELYKDENFFLPTMMILILLMQRMNLRFQINGNLTLIKLLLVESWKFQMNMWKLLNKHSQNFQKKGI